MTDTARIAIAGASGYGGAEALRWLASHPHFDVVAVSSRSWAGKRVAQMHPQMEGFYAGVPIVAEPEELLNHEPDAMLLALPHRESAARAYCMHATRPQMRIVDLSGDHRLPDPEGYAANYGAPHPHPEVLGTGAWMYGFSEANHSWIAGSTRIANPGCFATGALVGAYPLCKRGLVQGMVKHVGITGSSGGGATVKPGTHHPERTESVRAYKVLAHQHVAEIVAGLAPHGLDPATPWLMVPQSGPFARGIFTTLFMELVNPMTQADIRAVFAETYEEQPLIRMRAETPILGHVRNTAFCDVSVASQGDQVIVMTALDNLGKGMVTQAIQNLNLMFGWDEMAGLAVPGARP